MIQAVKRVLGLIGTGLGTSLILTACADYEFRFNDRTVYTPAPLFTKYRLADDALADCVAQTIFDQKVTQAEELTRLVCTSAGITSLEGLDVFSGLTELNLANNLIADIAPIVRLENLRKLDLSNNALQDVSALMTLARLEWVDLTENTSLLCPALARLSADTNAQIVEPAMCREDAVES